MAIPAHVNAAAERLARAAYPHRRGTQVHFTRGYLAELGYADAAARCVGSYAEEEGRRAAREEASTLALRAAAPLRGKSRAHSASECGLPLFEPTLI